VAVSEKHNAAEPNIMAGGIVYQNWALKSPSTAVSAKSMPRF